MKKKIYKYVMSVKAHQTIGMPQNAEILDIQSQNEVPCIWVLVEPEAEIVKRTFELFGTGHDIIGDTERQYLGTVQLQEGALVLHCFECKK